MATFEENLRQLEDMVAKLENNEMPLEDALKAYEDGMKLVKTCQKQIGDLSLKVDKIVAAHTGDEGEMVVETEDFKLEPQG